ncbi:MAG: hypothetical protein Q7R30_23370 [Acidobacteriota bacterium]|nr:hypothetical protein [Acidobacteriota bacterium]
MRTVISRLSIAVVLAVAAWLSWSEAKLTARVATAKERLATLDLHVDDDLDANRTLSDYLPIDTQPLATDIRRTRTTVEYWLARYGEVIDEANGELDAEVLLAAANAAFRTQEREGGAGSARVQRLDGVLQAYVAVLKAEWPAIKGSPTASRMDAAYNYEYVSRVRDQVARRAGKPVKELPRTAAAPRKPGDLPAGPTVHGRPGGPPPDMKAEEMDVIAPMNYGDREAQPEATPGARRERKG